MQRRSTLLTGAILGCMAVIAGALGAHALKPLWSASQHAAYEKAVQYQMVHALLLVILGLSGVSPFPKSLSRSALAISLGVLLFCGSIYLLTVGSLWGVYVAWAGPITPLGGLSFVLGWCFLIYHGYNSNNQ